MDTNWNHVVLLTGLTHARIAHACDVSVSTVRAWNGRVREPSLMHQVQLLALARANHGRS